MKALKKTLAIVLAAIMALSVCSIAASAALADLTFADCGCDHYRIYQLDTDFPAGIDTMWLNIDNAVDPALLDCGYWYCWSCRHILVADEPYHWIGCIASCDLGDYGLELSNTSCSHRDAEQLPTGYRCGEGKCMITDNAADPAYKTYTYKYCWPCRFYMAYDGLDQVLNIFEDDLPEYGLEPLFENLHADSDDDGLCDICGAYRLTEEASDERYYLTIPNADRSYADDAEIWRWEDGGDAGFDLYLNDTVLSPDDDPYEYRILSRWITAPGTPVLDFVRLPIDINGLDTGDRWFDAYKLCYDRPDDYHPGDGYADDNAFSYYISTDGTVLKIECEYYSDLTEYHMFEEDPWIFDYVKEIGTFAGIPDEDSDDLVNGDYWFDRAGCLAYCAAFFNDLLEAWEIDLEEDAEYLDEEDVAAERERIAETAEKFDGLLQLIERGDYYLTEDGYILRVCLPEGELPMCLTETLYSGGWIWLFLRQHGRTERFAGFTELPTADSDELAYGDYWFDVEGMNEYEGDSPSMRVCYRYGSYYLSDDGGTLRICFIDAEGSDFWDFDLTDEENGAGQYYGMFLMRHGMLPDPFPGWLKLAFYTDEIPLGGWYFDVLAYVDDVIAAIEQERIENGEPPLTEAQIERYRSGYTAGWTNYDLYLDQEQGILGKATYDYTYEYSQEEMDEKGLLSYVKYYDGAWTEVHMTADGLAAGDYWFDVVNHVGNEEWIDFFLEFIRKIEVLPGVAKIRVTEMVEDEGVQSFIVHTLSPSGEGEDDYLYYDTFAPDIYLTFAANKESTCKEAGYENAIAIEKDGETVILVAGTPLALAEHTPGDTAKENDVPSTCTELGSYDLVTYCSVCGNPASTQHCAYTEYGAHDFGEMVREVSATCTAAGVKAHKTCSVCKKNFDANGVEIEDLTIQKLDHTPKAAVKENEVPATCTAGGSYDEVVYCSVCYNVITRTAKTTGANGHAWGNWAVTTPATATEKGVETRECSVCHAKETRDIAPTGTGDNGGNNGGSTDSGKCKWCGEDHSGSFWQKIVGFFHKVLYFFAHLFGRK